MPYFALMYDVVDQFVDRRRPLRDEHLALVREGHARGDIVMAGAIGEPPHGALLVFHTATADIAEEFARRDPYVREGLVTRWRAVPWHVVVERQAVEHAREP